MSNESTRSAESLGSSRTPRAVSLSGTTGSNSDALSQVLDRIHTTASQSEQLTEFNAFSSPPLSSSANDNNENAGDLVQTLYSRIRGAVDAAKEKAGSVVGVKDHRAVEGHHVSTKLSSSKDAVKSEPRHSGAPEGEIKDALRIAALKSPQPRPYPPPDSYQDEQTNTARTSFDASTVNQDPSTMPRLGKGPQALLSKPAVSSPVDPELAPVNVWASQEGNHDSDAEGFMRKDRPMIMSPDSEISSAFGHASRAATTSSLQKLSGPPSPHMALPAIERPSVTSLAQPMSDGHGRGTTREAAHMTNPASVNPEAYDVLGYTSRSLSHNHRDQSQGTLQDAGLSKMTTVGGDRGRVSSPSGLSGTGQPTLAANHRSASYANDDQQATASKSGLVKDPPNDISLLPAFSLSRASSFDRSVADGERPMALNHALGGGVRKSRSTSRRRRAHGADTHRGQSGTAAAASKQIRNRVLSRDFWMKDENCTECFLCGEAFSTFRRKHHCRT